MTLDELQDGEIGYIVKVRGRGAFRKRLLEMGFIKGREVIAVRNAPLKDPVEYSILGYNISLRRSEAGMIEIITNKEEEKLIPNAPDYSNSKEDVVLEQRIKEKSNEIEVVLVGNPNCGKTTIFNFISGMHERVGNYSGVTVDSKYAVIQHGDYKIKITDLPGAYSLSAFSPEELFIRKYIIEKQPDIIINVIDSSNLERNLYLTTQLIDMDQKIILALNMFDELEEKGDSVDLAALSSLLGISVATTVGNKNKGIKELLDKVIAVFEDKEPLRHIHINYGHDFEPAISALQTTIKKDKNLTDKVSSRFAAIKLLEKDKDIENLFIVAEDKKDIIATKEKLIQEIEKHLNDDTESLLAEIRYGFIAGALKETYFPSQKKKEKYTTTQKIDNVLTNKYIGFPIFLCFLFLMFQATFTLGALPMGWIETGIGILRESIGTMLNDGFFKDLLLNGVIDGVGGVIVFLPNILILFFFISFMEDTGYMARAAFIMDKIMHFIGLHGKSFIPLIMGFGCNVPAILSTRTLENKNDRILTMLINPFFSCSARLPVYILFIGAFFPDFSVLVLFLVYLIGILFAVFFSILFKKIFFRKQEAPFVMELPPYRIPTLRATLSHMWFRASLYLKKMGGIILIASLIIWLLGYFPREIEYSKDYLKEENIIKENFANQLNDSSLSVSEKTILKNTMDSLLSANQLEKECERLENSYIGTIGKWTEPLLRPLGFDWKISVSLISGLPAKEIVISTLGVLYQAKGDDDSSLREKLITEEHTSGKMKGKKVFNPFVAFAFLMFTLLYSPCIATIIAIKRESGNWRWAAFEVIYTTAIAWLVAFAVVTIGPMIF